MSMFSFFSRGSRKRSSSKSKQAHRNLELETLEGRCLPSTTTISGYVYQDTNNNGLFDPGEQTIGNTPIQLRNSANVVVGNTTTNASGYYEFTYDASIAANPATLTKTVSYPQTQTNFALNGVVDQFDSSLGQLQSVEIIQQGSITSEIKVENTSPLSPSTITGTVGGKLTLDGPGVHQVLTLDQNVGTANLGTYDNNTDFGGTSGISFGAKTASGTASTILTGAAMNAFIGTGQVTLKESATATSNATGEGNLMVAINSSGLANVKVIYHYVPTNALKPGNYTIYEMTQPPGLLDGQESRNGVVLSNAPGVDKIPVTIDGINDADNNNFGELPMPLISGYVYVDANDNGIKDPGESGIAGVSVALTGTDDQGSVTKTATTNANGLYQFQNLRPGTYTVTETQPSGYYDGKDTAGTLGGTVTNDKIAGISLPAAVNSINNNFGELPPASLSGYAYVDANDNGIKDAGEAGIAGVQIALSGNANQTAFTDANGFYKFSNLGPGTYAIAETQPSGYIDGKDTIGTQGGQVSNDLFTSVPLQGGTQGQNNNFGELPQASISGYVYVDGDNDGIKDGGEAGIAGVQITLSGNNVNQTAFTDANGFYKFSNLGLGTYSLAETQPSGYIDGKDTIGTQGGQVSNDLFTSIPLQGGTQGLNNNFGEQPLASISGYAYVDSDNDGIKDASEVGIAGVQVNLSGAANQTAFTDANGFYKFSNLGLGTYSIAETQPSGYIDGKDTIGSQGGQVSNDLFTNIQLQGGTQGVNNNFGELQGASLSGYAYVDSNNNGVKDSGEAGIAGVSVALSGSDEKGAVSKTAITDGTGLYQFQNLRPGTYAINETQPAGYLDGKDAIGSQGGITGNDVLSGISLAAGVQGVNNNFGELNVSGLSGYVWVDTNNNGVKDPGELGISGVSVALTGSDDNGSVSKNASTDAAGFYQFANLRPGTYTVTETQPGAYMDGKDAVGSLGGNLGNDQFTLVLVAQNAMGTNYNFGELSPAGLSGHVYADKNENGARDPGEPGISGVIVTLTGSDDKGAVSKTTTTDANGLYQFQNLRPGTYVITETQPSDYNDGQESMGSAGGSMSNDQFSAIVLGAGVLGANYDFGELLKDNADLAITKTADHTSVLVGSNVTYTLTVTNNGTYTANQVVVQDMLPADATFVSAFGPGWTITRVGNALTATTATLPVGVSAVITITIKAPLITEVMLNTATVTSSTPDKNPSNNNASVNVFVYNQPGQTFPSVITPLVTQFGVVTIVGKGVLIGVVEGGTTTTSATNLATYIDGIYRTLTGKPVDATTLSTLLPKMQAGTLTRQALVASVWNSDAHRTLQANALYQTFLDRLPTSPELSATVASLKAGMTETALAIQLLSSSEYQQTHPTSLAMVAGLYADVLGTVPDLASLTATVQAMAATPWSTFVQQTMNSPTALNQMVTAVFQSTVRRLPTAAELQTWTAQLQSGLTTPAQMAQTLLASNEFFTLAYTSAK